jgi:hypothetical protein
MMPEEGCEGIDVDTNNYPSPVEEELGEEIDEVEDDE